MIAIIDYGMGNLRSVEKALQSLGADCMILSRPGSEDRFQGVILPGVGAFGDAMCTINREGWSEWIREIIKREIPFLGICLGMHLLFNRSEENNGVEGLGVIPGEVKKFPPEVGIIPHMGWNQLNFIGNSPLFSCIAPDSYVYFVHSYYVLPDDMKVAAAITQYGIDFVSAIVKDNIFGLQFHPEKSQAVGLNILKNFLKLSS